MSEPGTKLCPQCDGEFHAWVTQCPDCEVDLVAPGDLEQIRKAEPAATEGAAIAAVEAEQSRARVRGLAPNEGRLYRAGDQNHCVDIAHNLTAAGVAWRIAPIYGVFILEDDHEAADAALQQAALEGVPDAQPASADTDDQCPACSFKLRPGETECPECGLVFG